MKSLSLLSVLMVVLSVCAMGQVPSFVPSNGLIGWWPFNGNAIDESTNGHNGIVNGASLALDRFLNINKAFSFDGINDIITVNHTPAFNFSNGQSLSFWMNITAFPTSSTSESILFSKQVGSGSSALGFAISLSSNGYLNYRIGNGQSGTNGGVLFNAVSLNQWYHVICQFQNGLMSVYFNGQLSQSVTLSSTVAVGTSIGPMIIGDDTWGASNALNFSGRMDDIAIFTRSLNQQEITNIFNGGCTSSITNQPVNQVVNINDTANFSVVSSVPGAHIQWQSNPANMGWQNIPLDSNYSGVSTNSLAVNNVQLTNHNQPFRAILTTFGICVDTSNIAYLTLLDTCIVTTIVYDTIYTSVTDTLVINARITGSNPANIQNVLKIFPNPANTHITIDYGNFIHMSGYTLKIINSIGQEVFNTPISQQISIIDLSTWTGTGIYFVNLVDPQNRIIENRKIVVQ